MRDYVYNWLSHTRRVAALLPYAAIAVDDALLQLCLSWGEPVLDAPALLQDDAAATEAISKLRALLPAQGYMRNEREGFKLLGFVKGRLTLGLLRRGYDVLLSDADTVWLGNPWPWIGGGAAGASPAADAGMLPLADVLTTNDYPDFRRDGQPDTVFNTGALFFRATPRAIALVEEWAERDRQQVRTKGSQARQQLSSRVREC